MLRGAQLSPVCAWQCGLSELRFKLGRGGAGQNITVLGQRDSLSFIHPLSICPFLERGCFKSCSDGLVQVAFPPVSGAKRTASKEAGCSNLDPSLALLVKVSSPGLGQILKRGPSVQFVGFPVALFSSGFRLYQHPLLTPKMWDSKREL